MIPAGVLLTVPVPVPALLTPRLTELSAKVAVTVVSALRTTVQESVPLHPPPLQPVNVDPVPGAAVRVTMVPLA